MEAENTLLALSSSHQNCCHPPLPTVDEAPSPSTRRRLHSVTPPLTRRRNAFCSTASTYFFAKLLMWPGGRICSLGIA